MPKSVDLVDTIPELDKVLNEMNQVRPDEGASYQQVMGWWVRLRGHAMPVPTTKKATKAPHGRRTKKRR